MFKQAKCGYFLHHFFLKGKRMKKNFSGQNYYPVRLFLMTTLLMIFFIGILSASESLIPADVLKIRTCTSAQISPDGDWITYTLSIPRKVTDDAGSAYSELHLISVKTGEVKSFISGKVNVRSPRWSPDGEKIGFLMKRGEKAKTQIWSIPAHGGEAVQISNAGSNVLSFEWHPAGKKIVYLATTPKSQKELDLEKKGYGFIYYQENLKHRNLYLLNLIEQDTKEKIVQLTKDVTIWDFYFSRDGKKIAASVSPENLIDHRYMFRKINILDLESRQLKQLTDNPGKLGNYAFSPDGSKLVYNSALSREDHQISQVFVINTKGGKAKNLTIPDFRGHVNWVGWQDDDTVIYRSGEGVWSTLSAVPAEGGDRDILLDSESDGLILSRIKYNRENKFVMIGGSPDIPGDVFYWEPGEKMKRMTNVNLWLDNKTLGEQKVIRYNARDGLEIEGLIIYPVGYVKGKPYPLIVYVHGGPESHYYNGWVTWYSTPGQVMAGKGYVIFYPNYRASTGYGVKFSMEGFGDPAGKEFDDIADGIGHLVAEGIADNKRVGMAGGSYGGYASAWFATYYTKYVKAVCMFVGLSDVISRMGTTDIPYEELYVHSGKKLEEMWQLALERSPIYWAHQSKTATLIYGGAADTRVHPSQSMELYWRMRMNDHKAVRLVQYPGERHGNSKQPGRADVIHRQIQWFDWYVYNSKPLDGPLPPLDLSENYGLDLHKCKCDK